MKHIYIHFMMSGGIPTFPKKQLREADDSENEEEEPTIQEEDSDAESGGGDASSNASGGDSDDASSAALSSDVSEDEEDDDEAEREGGDSSADEGEGGDDEEPSISTKRNKKKGASSGRKKNMEDDMTLLGVPHGIYDDDDEDEDDDDDSDEDKDSSEYFQKLKSTVRESYIDTYHPESMSHNYDEIQTLAKVVRNSAGVIVDDLHKTIPIMTKYEKTRILGQRAKQINEGAPAFIKIDSTVIDGYLIAVKELEQKKTPFIIRRPLPNGGSEYWRVQDLEIL